MIRNYNGVKPVISPDAFIHDEATIIGEVRLEADVSVMPCAVLRGDQGAVEIGVCSNIQDGAICHATDGISTLKIGERVTVGHGAIVHGAKVGDDCIIGMGSIILDNAEISSWSIVAAGSLVPPGKKYPEGVLLVGNPARVAREITEEDRKMIEHSWKEYLRLTENYRSGDGE